MTHSPPLPQEATPTMKWTIGSDGNWHRVPMILVRSKAGLSDYSEEREPLRSQLLSAIGFLILLVVVFPPIFIAADWLRHGWH